MEFEHRRKKPIGSGRKLGTPNKRTLHLAETLNNLNFDVPERLIKLLPKLSPEKQAEILIDLMGYLYPKRKAVEFISEEIPPEKEPIILVAVSPNGEKSEMLFTANGLIPITSN